MKEYILKLPRNRVRRNYMGGAGIDALHHEKVCKDNDQPEEWVGSMVEATNLGLPVVENEGLCMIPVDGKKVPLRDVVDEEKHFYLGEDIHADGSWQLSFLFKILDSSMRLHVQVHPTTQFANQYLGKPYGKLECYYILGVRKGTDPYIRLGFQHAPTKEEWKRIIETQDKAAMDACFEKVPVAVGDVWYIPGGMPHAIGDNITMLEIMEPSDLVVRCEFEREGIVVPPAARFMGEGLDFCLDIFDYHEYSKEYIREHCKITPVVKRSEEGFLEEELIGEKLTECFFVHHFVASKSIDIEHPEKFTLGVICEGACTIVAEEMQEDVQDHKSVQEQKGAQDKMDASEQKGARIRTEKGIHLTRGDSFMIAAACRHYSVIPEGEASFVEVWPGKDMKRKHV